MRECFRLYPTRITLQSILSGSQTYRETRLWNSYQRLQYNSTCLGFRDYNFRYEPYESSIATKYNHNHLSVRK